MRRLIPFVAVLGLLVVGGGAALAGAGNLPPELQAVRAAVARYHSVEQATADGYFAASACEASPAGTMGIHFIQPALMADPAEDPLEPEVLVYLPTAAGDLELVAVEYFRADADQNLATDGDRPFLFGRGFDGPMLGHNPQMPIHYDLHAWVGERNPSGVFSPWNPAIHCP